MVLRVIPTNKENRVPIVESRFYGTATSVEAYAKQLKENGYSYKAEDGKTYQSGTYSAVHQADFVGNKLLLGLVGSNASTGGNCLLCYSHSNYFAEIPDEHLKNANDTTKIDNNGKEIKNPEYKKYTDIWGEPQKDAHGNFINLSLPKEVILENGKIRFKGEDK